MYQDTVSSCEVSNSMPGLFIAPVSIMAYYSRNIHSFGLYITHVGTLSQALVTQLVLRLCASDKDLCVDESSNFLRISYYANIR